MSINQTCEDIVRVVNLSKLDYQMNQQTPYSMHFSIRKKFLKGHNPNLYNSPEVAKDCEIFHLKQEYQKLYDLYQIASAAEAKLSSDLSNLKTEADALKSDLIIANEDLSVKEEQIKSLEKNIVYIKIESNGNRVENAASKKEKKVKKKQNVPSKKMKGVEADSILETDSNQNVFKVIPNVPVSNSFSILDEDNLQDETPPIISTLSNVLSASDSKLSSNTSQEISTSSATSLLSTSPDDASDVGKRSGTSNKTEAEISKLLLMFSKHLDDSIELMNRINYKPGDQAK